MEKNDADIGCTKPFYAILIIFAGSIENRSMSLLIWLNGFVEFVKTTTLKRI